jgi:uncharacterized membrane protein
MNSRDLTTALLVVLALFVGLPLIGMVMMGGTGMMGPGMMAWRASPQGGWGWWGGVFGLLVPLLVLGAIALVVVTLMRRSTSPDDAVALLKLRLARGEISKEQFDDLKHALQ